MSWLMDVHDWRERRACQAVGLPRSMARYKCPVDRDEAVIALLAEQAERFPERGFDKLFQLIRLRGLVWNQKRVWRVYCLMQLNRRRRGNKRYRTSTRCRWWPTIRSSAVGRSTSCPTPSGTGGALVRSM
jgi:hypothetical protein